MVYKTLRLQRLTSDLVRSYKMDNVKFVKITNELTDEVTEHAIIDRGNGDFTSMLKAEYDRQQAEQSTPIAPE
jgi:hypothetical protein